MKKLIICSLIILTGIFQSCKEDIIGQTSIDSEAPGKPKDIEIISIPGGAKITYQLPLDEDLLFTEAQYEINGKIVNVKASCFEDTLKLEGYTDMNEHEVKLYCVDRSNNYSEPILLKIRPEEDPVSLVRKSMEMKGDIGGVHITWTNTTQAPINIMVYAADSLGVMQLADVVPSNVLKGNYYLRGYNDQKRRFAAMVKDRWSNYSDSIADYFTPRYEKIIPGKDIKRYIIAEDNTTTMGNYNFESMFNGITEGATEFWHTDGVSTDPEHVHGPYFTIDLGHLVKLTRYKLYQRSSSWCYIHHNPKVWELYGREEDPKLIYKKHFESDIAYWAEGFRTDSENWNHFGQYFTDKPSGFDNPIITAADKEYATKMGHEFIISEDAPPVRYLRFTIDQTWGGGMNPTLLHIAELEFYGKIIDKEVAPKK